MMAAIAGGACYWQELADRGGVGGVEMQPPCGFGWAAMIKTQVFPKRAGLPFRRGYAARPLTFLHAFGSQGTPTMVALLVNLVGSAPPFPVARSLRFACAHVNHSVSACA